MARLRFSILGREVFRTTLTVRVDDINYAGHLGHDSVLTLCHEARVKLLRDIGQSERDLFGLGIIMTDAMASYLAEGVLGDARHRLLAAWAADRAEHVPPAQEGFHKDLRRVVALRGDISNDSSLDTVSSSSRGV